MGTTAEDVGEDIAVVIGRVLLLGGRGGAGIDGVVEGRGCPVGTGIDGGGLLSH